MTLFKFSKTWCEEIARLVARFWWNGRDDKREVMDKAFEYMGIDGYRDARTDNYEERWTTMMEMQ